MASFATSLVARQAYGKYLPQVAYAVAAKQLDSQRQQGHIAVQLLEAAVKMAAQVNGDSIDTYA